MHDYKNEAIILFLGANPSDTTQLELPKEAQAIDDRLRNTELRDQFKIEQQWEPKAQQIPGKIMRFNPSVRKYVSENADEKLYSVIYEREDGMQAFNHSLKDFVDREYISRAAAFEISPNPEQLKMWLKGITTKAS